MSFLPIVGRELLGASRAASTYWNRVITVGVVTVIAGFMLLTEGFGAGSTAKGSAMFSTLSFLALLYCLLEGIRKTADCLSGEKREGTLGLLFLTHLKGYDVVLGKLSANSLNSLYGLASIMPVLALPMLMGGVLPEEFWRTALALFNALFFSLCAGIWVSSFGRDETSSMTRTFWLLVLIVLAPLSFPFPYVNAFSPAHAFALSRAAFFPSRTAEYFISLGITQLGSWTFLILASVTLPNSWQQEKDAIGRTPRKLLKRLSGLGRKNVSPAERARMLDENPLFWLASRDGALVRSGSQFVIVAAAIGVFAFIAALAFQEPVWCQTICIFVILNLFFKIRFAQLACRCTAEARRNNGFELILVTPMDSNAILQGLSESVRSYQGKGFWMLIIEFVTLFGGAIASADLAKKSPGYSSGMEGSVNLIELAVIAYLVIFMLDLAAIPLTGAWMGLVSKKESSAVIKTVLYLLVIPLFSPLLSCLGALLLFVIPFFCMSYFDQKLRTEFRSVVENQYEYKSGGKPKLPVATAP